MSRNLRNLKPKKIERGAFEEQKKREENKAETQRALLFILPLIMLAVLVVGIFFGYKFYQSTVSDHDPIAPGEIRDSADYAQNPLFYRAVNSALPLKEDVKPETVESCGIEIAPEAAQPLEKLVSDGAEQGYEFLVQEGYISFEEQKEKYAKAVKDYRKKNESSLVMAEAKVKRTLPPAGESEQQTGLLVYLTVRTDGTFAETPAYSWLARNCVDYGFILRYPEKENVGGYAYSSHLFRFVGVENAYKMRALDMNFDEYLAYLAAQ